VTWKTVRKWLWRLAILALIVAMAPYALNKALMTYADFVIDAHRYTEGSAYDMVIGARQREVFDGLVSYFHDQDIHFEGQRIPGAPDHFTQHHPKAFAYLERVWIWRFDARIDEWVSFDIRFRGGKLVSIQHASGEFELP
jgi:hypothetical protein